MRQWEPSRLLKPSVVLESVLEVFNLINKWDIFFLPESLFLGQMVKLVHELLEFVLELSFGKVLLIQLGSIEIPLTLWLPQLMLSLLFISFSLIELLFQFLHCIRRQVQIFVKLVIFLLELFDSVFINLQIVFEWLHDLLYFLVILLMSLFLLL